MNLEKKFVLFMTIFIVTAMAYLFLKDTGNSRIGTSEAAEGKDQNQIIAQSFVPKTTGSMGSGDALIELTPQIGDKNFIIVTFNINSHSVSLNGFDLKEITVLEHREHIFKPVRASRIGGHHASGTMVFDVGNKIGSKDRFKIRLLGIPDVQERVYDWS